MAFDKKVKDGDALHRAPYGYKYVNAKLVPDENKANNVKEIFSMWQAGISYKDIIAKFEIPTSTFYEIVKNPMYIGKIQYRGQLFSGNHKPLISEEQFLAINPPSETEKS
jgi:site-specific DNA recombinase